MKSVWKKLCISGNYFSPRQKVILRYCWGVRMSSGGRRLQSEVRKIWSQCLSLSQKQCILCGWQGWLLVICLSWLPSVEKMQRCSFTLEGHWSQEQLISTGERLRSPSRFLSPCLPLHSVEDRQGWGILSVFCSEKWKFELGRWSKASKDTCNWAALDRLSENMKRQRLWRRVIASLGPYNALSSL